MRRVRNSQMTPSVTKTTSNSNQLFVWGLAHVSDLSFESSPDVNDDSRWMELAEPHILQPWSSHEVGALR